MFRLIVAKELREIIASTKFAITFLVCSILILLSFYVGAKNYKISVTQYEMAKAENLRQMGNNTDWRNIEHRISLPPQPLATLVTGVVNDIGRNIQIQERGGLEAADSRFNDDPIFAVFHFLDLDFLFQVILSLFAILFVYNAVNGEKEQGTLRLTFSNAIPRNTYILGKVTGAFLALGVPLLIPILVGCLLLPLMHVPMGSQEWIRLALIVFSGFIFLGAFAIMSLFVSTITHRSSSSFLIMLVVWIFAVLIIPRASVLLAGQAAHVISVDEMAYQRIMQENQDGDEGLQRLAKYKATAKDYQAAMSDLLQFYEKMIKDLENKRQLAADRLDEQRRNQEARQQHVALGLARISPAAAFALAATNIAGTSLNVKRHYQDEAVRYREGYASFIRQKTGGRMIDTRPQAPGKPKPINPRELPEFKYQERSLKETLRAAVPDLGILALFNLIFFAGAFTAFLRYDVR